eukprot:227941-Pyramimonas_sp.AAC.1
MRPHCDGLGRSLFDPAPLRVGHEGPGLCTRARDAFIRPSMAKGISVDRCRLARDGGMDARRSRAS